MYNLSGTDGKGGVERDREIVLNSSYTLRHGIEVYRSSSRIPGYWKAKKSIKEKILEKHDDA